MLIIVGLALATLSIFVQHRKAATEFDVSSSSALHQFIIHDASGKHLKTFFDEIDKNSKVAARLAEVPTRQLACQSSANFIDGFLNKLGILTTVSVSYCSCTGGCLCLGCNQMQAVNDCGVACDHGPDWSTYYDSESSCSGGQNNGMTN